MKELAEKFEKNGFRHKQLSRTETHAIYYRESIKHPDNNHYEVIEILRHNGYTIPASEGAPERVAPPSEYYPSSEAWGRHGWTFKDQEAAEMKFKEFWEKDLALNER